MTSRNSEKPGARKYGSPAVDRALDIMEYMVEHRRPYGATELSRILKIPKNTVFRILRSLAERDYAVQDPTTGGYQMSSGLFVLGMKLYTRFELRARARPHLELLCRETEQTCQLQTPYNDRTLVLDTVNPDLLAYYHAAPGGTCYYHPNAFGKAMLAFMPEEKVKSILPTKMKSLTANTIVERKILIAGLEEIRKTGLAYDNEEYTIGIFCIGAPVFGAEGDIVAGLGTTGLSSWFDRHKRPLVEKSVLSCAYRVSKDIGYSGDYFADKVEPN
jgi:DNA-binding IclR family transcriptional regulator